MLNPKKNRTQVLFNIDSRLYSTYKKKILDARTTVTADLTRHIQSVTCNADYDNNADNFDVLNDNIQTVAFNIDDVLFLQYKKKLIENEVTITQDLLNYIKNVVENNFETQNIILNALKKQVVFRIDANLFKEYKLAVLEYRTTVTDELVNYIKDVVEKKEIDTVADFLYEENINRTKVSFKINEELYISYKKVLLDKKRIVTADLITHIQKVVTDFRNK